MGFVWWQGEMGFLTLKLRTRRKKQRREKRNRIKICLKEIRNNSKHKLKSNQLSHK